MSFAPIVMFVYNRADHFIKTYESLIKCPEVTGTDLFIFSDGAKDQSQVQKVEEVRNSIRNALEISAFRNVKVIERDCNWGLVKSVIGGVTEIIEEYGKVIVIEDDNVVSPYFLKFMNMSLEYYEKNEKIGSIAGFTPNIRLPKEFAEDMFLAFRSCSCSWATWKDRWSDVDWKLKNVGEFYRNSDLRKRLNSNGRDQFIRLHRQAAGKGSSWAVRFGAHLVKKNQLTIYPKYSYVQNIGCDETGVHSKMKDAIKVKIDLTKSIQNPRLKELEVSPEMQKIMKKHYSDGFFSDIKRTVATIIFVLQYRWKNG